MSNTEPLMTAADVARQLNVHEETVRRWTRDGKLPAVRLPNRTVRYEHDAVARFVSTVAALAEPVAEATR